MTVEEIVKTPECESLFKGTDSALKVAPDGRRRFLCVEPTAGYPGKITLAPGGTHGFAYEILPRAGAGAGCENAKGEVGR